MNIRKQQEDIERSILSPNATFSDSTQGRVHEEEECDVRTAFQRDRDRILHSKSFRRLKHKTQVFIAPEGDHYRTRLTHTLEVAQIARTVARALRLNEDLTEAIALGHDLGHTPFGHAGEEALNDISPLGFKHYLQSVRVIERLENKGRGLNLTWEVRDGIENHSFSRMPSTFEGKVVRYSDKIAYINHDIDDALRGKIFDVTDIPTKYLEILGHTTKDRINNMIHNIINNSYDADDIQMSTEYEKAMKELRQYMFDNVYIGSKAKSQEKKAKKMIQHLYNYLTNNPDKLPQEYQNTIVINGEPVAQVVCDYIAGMTDTYAINTFQEIFIPKAWDIY